MCNIFHITPVVFVYCTLELAEDPRSNQCPLHYHLLQRSELTLSISKKISFYVLMPLKQKKVEYIFIVVLKLSISVYALQNIYYNKYCLIDLETFIFIT